MVVGGIIRTDVVFWWIFACITAYVCICSSVNKLSVIKRAWFLVV